MGDWASGYGLATAASLVIVASGCSLLLSTDDLSGDREDAAGASDADGGSSLSEGLLLWFPFDEGTGTTADDKGPAAQTGTLGGGAMWTQGRIGSAIAFDGAEGSVVRVNWHPSIALGEELHALTWAAWVKADERTCCPRLYSHGHVFDIKLNGQKAQLSAGGQYQATSYRLPYGEWHHLAVTFERGKVAWYVDGFSVPNSSSGTFTEDAVFSDKQGTDSNRHVVRWNDHDAGSPRRRSRVAPRARARRDRRGRQASSLRRTAACVGERSGRPSSGR
jgi:hypothetical protein